MLNEAQLTDLYRSLSDERVLSVYIDGSATNPAEQRSWRLQLLSSLTDLQSWLEDSPRDERIQFDACVKTLETLLPDLEPAVGSLGWAAFITTEGVRHAGPLPAAAPTLAVWSTGPCISPYMRALEESRPVVVVLSDARKATVHRYRVGKLDHVEKVRAYRGAHRWTHMGTPPRAGFHTGTRGTAGHDAMQHSLLEGRDRMLAETVERTVELAGPDGWILVGGIKRVVARLAADLSPAAPNRFLELESLDVHASEADIAEAARIGAGRLRDAADSRRIADITEQAGARALGALGPADTKRALDLACVRDLYLSRRYCDDHAAEAEVAVRVALEQNASIEEVSGRAATLLDQYGGVAAGLRFRPPAIDTASSA